MEFRGGESLQGKESDTRTGEGRARIDTIPYCFEGCNLKNSMRCPIFPLDPNRRNVHNGQVGE